MTVPRRVAFVVAAALGASVAVLPAIAGSETIPTVDAVNIGGIYGEEHHWQPAQVTIAPGATVTFANATEVAHGVEWRGTVKPSCEEGPGKVPVGTSPSASGTNWSGSCSFSQAGTYSFYCTVHGAAMRGTISVEAGVVTTVTTGTASQPPAGTTTTTTPTTPGPGTPQVLLAVPALQALKLPAHQRGGSVQGSVSVSAAAADAGRLEVDVLARRSALEASGHGAGRVRVGRLVRSSLSAGSVHFAVSLDRRARNALRRHRRLALSVAVRLTGAGGQAVTLTRSVFATRH
jgi:plastocyanin